VLRDESIQWSKLRPRSRFWCAGVKVNVIGRREVDVIGRSEVNVIGRSEVNVIGRVVVCDQHSVA
jgi:hypothetical protein